MSDFFRNRNLQNQHVSVLSLDKLLRFGTKPASVRKDHRPLGEAYRRYKVLSYWQLYFLFLWDNLQSPQALLHEPAMDSWLRLSTNMPGDFPPHHRLSSHLFQPVCMVQQALQVRMTRFHVRLQLKAFFPFICIQCCPFSQPVGYLGTNIFLPVKPLFFLFIYHVIYKLIEYHDIVIIKRQWI